MEKRNIVLKLSYDGTCYHGFQRQKNGLTVQEAIESAIQSITGEEVSLTGCGRTDAGVHAEVYYANFETDSAILCEKLPLAINSKLQDDIRIITAQEVSPDFHARFSAKKKAYAYTIDNSNAANVFLRNYSWFYPKKLDTEKMRKAAEYIIGEHDFAAFMASGSPVKSTVRNVEYIDISENGNIIEIEIMANGFLYNMVRIIVGTLVYAGVGKIAPEDIPGIIASKNRVLAGKTAPAKGLRLKKVVYEQEKYEEN